MLWHQDLSLAVQERRERQDWTNWSEKRGVHHVQPPAELLERMVTMRLHLDDCPAENGALRVIPGSHEKGQLARDAIQTMAAGPVETITAKAGDALFMRPSWCTAHRPPRSPGTAGCFTWNSLLWTCFRQVWPGPNPDLLHFYAAA